MARWSQPYCPTSPGGVAGPTCPPPPPPSVFRFSLRTLFEFFPDVVPPFTPLCRVLYGPSLWPIVEHEAPVFVTLSYSCLLLPSFSGDFEFGPSLPAGFFLRPPECSRPRDFPSPPRASVLFFFRLPPSLRQLRLRVLTVCWCPLGGQDLALCWTEAGPFFRSFLSL